MYFAIRKKTIMSGTARPPWWGKSTRDKFEKKEDSQVQGARSHLDPPEDGPVEDSATVLRQS